MKKSFFIFLLFVILGSSTFSQGTSDTTFIIDNQSFAFSLATENSEQLPFNTTVTILQNGSKILFDTVFCANGFYDFQDINDDGFDDFLVYQSSGARANETFNLYLYRSYEKDFKKVIGYNDWPNMHKTDYRRVLCSTILTGSIQYKFFKVTDEGELVDLNVSVEEYRYDGKGYKKGIKKIKRLYPNGKKMRTTQASQNTGGSTSAQQINSI